jgi:ribonuclease HI
MNKLEREQMINGTSEALATLIFEKVDRAYEDAAFIDALILTRDIFELDEGSFPATNHQAEFNAVCNAIDFLIEEGSVWFDTRNGHVVRV